MKFKSIYFYVIRNLKSEDTVDALRNTAAVVLPIVVFSLFGQLASGIGISVGALLICMTDLPGNRTDKIHAAGISIPLFTLIALISAGITFNPLLMIPVMVVLTFVLSMLSAMGNRMTIMGSIGIALATFTIGLKPADEFLYATLVFVGGVWYYSISLLQIYIFPYRSLRRAILATQLYTADLLSLRADGYNPTIALGGFSDKNIKLHLKLANQHELMRQLLLGDRKAMKQQRALDSVFVSKATNLIDLYEQVSAVHYDYRFLREKLSNCGALPIIQQLIELLGSELRKTDSAALTGKYLAVSAKLHTVIESAEVEQAELLKKIELNLVQIHDLILAYKQGLPNQINNGSEARNQEFLTLPAIQTKAIHRHFTLQSPVFRFSMRLAILSLAALVLITVFSKEHYSYWLLLTMLVVSRPSYTLTVRRNIERLIGTVFGIALGWTIASITTVPLQLVFAVVFLFGFFAFNRLVYSLSVAFITMAVLLCLNVYDGNLWQLITERILFTALGVFLCLAAMFLFPIWNAPRLKDLVADAIHANVKYFHSVVNLHPHDLESIHQTRLARKNAHQHLASLSETIAAAQHEPFHKKYNWSLIRRIQLLNYQINVLTAAFAGMRKTGRDLMTNGELEKVTADLTACMATSSDINLSALASLPTWAGERMNLMNVAAQLALLLKLNVAKPLK